MSDEQPTNEPAASERLREHPTPRFAAPQHYYDLDAVTTKLREEQESGQSGHRQQTLYKHGSTTVALFLFGELSGLAAHRAQGVVMIHVLDGHIQITATGEVHDLRAGHLLMLAPGVEHDVSARIPSRMLLTVHLTPRPTPTA